MDLQDLSSIKAILENLGVKEQSKEFISKQLGYASELINSLHLTATQKNKWNELSKNLVLESD